MSRDADQRPKTTADKLIAAGIELFGELGFKSTTTRMIADRAGANIGSIAYYFGNKRGLYLAIAHHISERLGAKLGVDRWQESGAMDDLAPEQVRERLTTIARAMVRLFAWDTQARQWLLLIIREQVNPSEAFDVLYDNAFYKVHSHISAMIGRLLGLDGNSPRTLLETHFFVGQIVFLLIGRTPLLRRLGGAPEYSRELVTLAEQVIASHVERLWPAT